MSGALTRFLGDSPLRVLLKLIVVSFLVGLVMITFGWSPMDIVFSIRDAFVRVWQLGFAAFDGFIGYFVAGAVIVIPAFLILRLLSYRR